MEVINANLSGVVEIIPDIYSDGRGNFREIYRNKEQTPFGNAVQVNQSVSAKGTVRGLHFQKPPYAQAKLVRAVCGKILDVAVDIRRDSPTFGQHVAVELSEAKGNELYIPIGFAHGFLALTDNAVVEYLVFGASYNKESEGGILYNSPDLNIEWGDTEKIISDKDLVWLPFNKKTNYGF